MVFINGNYVIRCLLCLLCYDVNFFFTTFWLQYTSKLIDCPTSSLFLIFIFYETDVPFRTNNHSCILYHLASILVKKKNILVESRGTAPWYNFLPVVLSRIVKTSGYIINRWSSFMSNWTPNPWSCNWSKVYKEKSE